MNILKKIHIENIKGKADFEANFKNLTANQVNIVVAPNGYGKSTITTAFKAAASGRMKLNEKDVYKKNMNNHPKLEIEFLGENAATYISTDTCGEISKNVTVYTINSPLYAKNTTRIFDRNFSSTTADLRVEKVVIYKKIPENIKLDYSYRNIISNFGNHKKLFSNIDELLSDCENIYSLLQIKDSLKKCCSQQGITKKFQQFLENCPEDGSSKEIKQQIKKKEINSLRSNINIDTLLECISKMNNRSNSWCDADDVFTAIQLCTLFRKYFDSEEKDILKKVYSYLSYKKTKALINERLKLFNTTGRNIQTHEEHGKLIIKFERASSMSNGERDILSFISNLTKFEVEFKKRIGILIIDEVFDYLDGSNLLAVQYYLSQLIKKCKKMNKILYPIIFTHLDPDVFANYYFKKKKIHYLSAPAIMDINSPIIKLLRARENKNSENNIKEEIEKYIIHFIDEKHPLSNELLEIISREPPINNLEVRQELYNEINNKYLKDNIYDPIMVIAGIRIKIEELVYQKLDFPYKEEFIKKHKVINKLNYAEENGVEVPELYYLLQPLYNDGLHLKGNDSDIQNKMKSCYLKTDNLHIKRMVKLLFN